MGSLNTSHAVLSTVGTAFSAAAAGAALFAVRRANNTADSVARIERDRWHTDLTPPPPPGDPAEPTPSGSPYGSTDPPDYASSTASS